MDKPRRDFFDDSAPAWPSPPPETARKLRRVVAASGARPGETVLDAGCGTGVLVPCLLEAVGPDGTIHALDYAPGMIARVKTRGFPANVVPRVGDIHATGYPGAHFDRVFANACYPHFDDQPAALAEIRRILKPGGVLVVSHPIGRRAVNELHRRAHPAVRGDILPAPAALEKRFAAAGFRCLHTEDEPDFYLAVLEKPKAAAPA